MFVWQHDKSSIPKLENVQNSHLHRTPKGEGALCVVNTQNTWVKEWRMLSYNWLLSRLRILRSHLEIYEVPQEIISLPIVLCLFIHNIASNHDRDQFDFF